MSAWPWPVIGRLLDTGPLPERFPGQYSPEAKAAWEPWIVAARAGASLAELKALEPTTTPSAPMPYDPGDATSVTG